MSDDKAVRRRKKIKGPRNVDSRGYPIMLMGPSGKTRMVWSRDIRQGKAV